MRTSYDIIIGPVNTEKSNLQNELLNQVVFEVDPRANRIEIKKAVEEIFKVKVNKVRTINVKGKKKRRGLIIGKRKDWKKAVVQLGHGDKIEFFEGV
ncbi:MAG: 50S ribosomal protein L23 [Deltaproteobacteria bacterium]|nr:MAG: 50S ribosomal protein L23 [Deltaproteobacteria bacterium]PIE75286.1 MAG: 50S ribosomal protein L23 [Deltaproteobacteria bacterium]